MARGRKTGLMLPGGYRPLLGIAETELAIKFIKDYFQDNFAKALGLRRVSAPTVVTKASGINDYLSGVERPVGFVVKDTGEKAEIVQSLAKWKRSAIADYGFSSGEGLYTDMNAIRPDERLDNLHSIYVDQWDWELSIRTQDRNLKFLRAVVTKIYGVIKRTELAAHKKFPVLGRPILPQKIHFIHSEELEAMYPEVPPGERENRICEKMGAVFVIGIGSPLADGHPHDERAPDYDDWHTETGCGRRGLNGDILVWYPVLGCAFELSSMGIRVDKNSLSVQLKLKHAKRLPYHDRLLRGELPQTIGGGIGQSRLCMFFLRKAHIGEVQSAIWPKGMVKACRKSNIKLL